MALALIEFEALCGFISLKFTQSVTMGGLSLDGFLLEEVAEKLQLLKKNLGEGDFSALIELRKTVVEFSAQSQLLGVAFYCCMCCCEFRGTKNSTKITMKNSFAAPKNSTKINMQQQQLAGTITLNSSLAALLHTATTNSNSNSILQQYQDAIIGTKNAISETYLASQRYASSTALLVGDPTAMHDREMFVLEDTVGSTIA
ncbi:unnamed protein product [Camellia sinensis]